MEFAGQVVDDVKTWRATVMRVAHNLRDSWPQNTGDRPEKAVEMVLSGNVQVIEGIYVITNRGKEYRITEGMCNCSDAQTKTKYCKHYIAARIHYDVHKLLREEAPEVIAATNGHLPEQEILPALPPADTPTSLVIDCKGFEQGLTALAVALGQHFPEAAVSVTIKGVVRGMETLFTVRDFAIGNVLDKCDTALAWFEEQQPAATAPAAPPTPPPAPPPPARNGHGQHPYCQKHHAVLRRHERNGQEWWSHKTSDGSWCRGDSA